MSAVNVVIPVFIAFSAFKDGFKDEAKRLAAGEAEEDRSYAMSSIILSFLILSLIGYSVFATEWVGRILETIAYYAALFVGVRGAGVLFRYHRFPKTDSKLFIIFCFVFSLIELAYNLVTKVDTNFDATHQGFLIFLGVVVCLTPFFCIGEMISVKIAKKAGN